MSSAASSKNTYHHGDLRRALLEAAWALLEEEGLRALTLRAVARRVGVTHAAPYHHFADRDALLGAMREEAFDALDRAMCDAIRGVCDPLVRLSALGRVYIDFACARRERMALMFDHAQPTERPDPEPCAPALPPTFAHLVDALAACRAAGLAPQEDPRALAIEAWSLVHGFATLSTLGVLTTMPGCTEGHEATRDALLSRYAESLRARAAARPEPQPR